MLNIKEDKSRIADNRHPADTPAVDDGTNDNDVWPCSDEQTCW